MSGISIDSIIFNNISSDYGFIGNIRKGGFNKVDFTLSKQAPIVIVWGNNGEGKSSLLKTILGKDVYNIEGEFEIMFNRSNFNIKDKIQNFIPKSNIRTLYVPQNILEMFPIETCVNSVVKLWASLGSKDNRKNIDIIINDLGLAEEYKLMSNTHCDKISLGQAHLLAFIITFVYNPDLILFDEPTASTSSETKQKIIGFLQKLLKSSKFMIIVTHDPEVRNIVPDKKDGGQSKNTGINNSIISIIKRKN